MDAFWMSTMIRNRVLVAGIIFCLLFIGIICILISGQNPPLTIVPVMNSSDLPRITGSETPVPIDHNNIPISPAPERTTPDIPRILGTGIVVYEELEGGFFGVISDEGQRFIPRELPDDIRKNGTPVSFSFSLIPDMVSTFMWGEPVEIISIQALSPVSSSNPVLPLIEYERAGGVSGSYESLFIYPDGRGEVSKWNMVEQVSLGHEEIDNLTIAANLSGFIDLMSEYMPPGPVPDAVTHTITINNKSVKMTQSESPAQIKPLLSILGGILDKNSISPIAANMTLEGTSWRLASFIRKDGIPVILPDNSQIFANFENGNVINGSTGCNPYSASYNQSGKKISFGPVSMTRIACIEPGASDIESAYAQLLGKVTTVVGKQKTLSFADINNTTLLVFSQI